MCGAGTHSLGFDIASRFLFGLDELMIFRQRVEAMVLTQLFMGRAPSTSRRDAVYICAVQSEIIIKRVNSRLALYKVHARTLAYVLSVLVSYVHQLQQRYIIIHLWRSGTPPLLNILYACVCERAQPASSSWLHWWPIIWLTSLSFSDIFLAALLCRSLSLTICLVFALFVCLLFLPADDGNNAA